MTEWPLAGHPAVVLILGALLIPFLRGRARQAYLVLLPLLVLGVVLALPGGVHGAARSFGLDLAPLRVDTLGLVFAYVFGLVLVIGAVYALQLREAAQHVAAFVYAGSALGVVFAGDLVTLYVFWEMMVFASVWLIWCRRTEASWGAGWRYLLVHATGGVVLLAGIVLYYGETGSIAFDALRNAGPGYYLILIGFMVNAAVPPLHAWLTDAYPEATVTGAIFLSAITTKTAVYALMRGYAGLELLVWFGAVMAIYGVVYAVLANDIRRLLAYHIISQVGYMVAGIGMGTAMALNGAAAHAFTHILYKALLFMGAGAVIHATGRSKLTGLGGLYRHMPLTFLLYMVGAFSISAFPLFSGFVSKTMVVEAAAADHRAAIWLMLSLASAGTFLHTGLKLPYFTFLGTDSGLRPAEAPPNMLVAMGLAAFLCVLIGVRPGWLYALLPFPVEYDAYTLDHVLWELQLLVFTGLGFFLLLRHVGGVDKISLDTDWLYRKAGKEAVRAVHDLWKKAEDLFRTAAGRGGARLAETIRRYHGPAGILARTWPTGSMAFWTAVLLAAYMLLYYL